MNAPKPRQYFRDSWRPEDKAMESAEEALLETRHPDEIKRRQATRHRHTPPLRGFEKAPPSDAEKK